MRKYYHIGRTKSNASGCDALIRGSLDVHGYG
jgi:hypothetical protein